LSLQITWIYALYWVSIILWNFWNNKFTLPLDVIKYNRVILVQSSIKVTNQRDPLKVVTLDGLQTSECITIKGSGLLFKNNWKKARCLFASSQTSQWKLKISNFVNKLGNNFFKYPKEACPRRQCHNQISYFFFSPSEPSTVKTFRNSLELVGTRSK